VIKDIENEKLETDLRATEALLRDKDEEINKLSEQLIISQIETAAEIEKKDALIHEMRSKVSSLELFISDKANGANLTQPSTNWGLVSDEARQTPDCPAAHFEQPAHFGIKIDRRCHYRGSLEAHQSNFEIELPHTSHGGQTEKDADKKDISLASPVSKLADSEILEKEIESEVKRNPLKLPRIIGQQRLDKAVQTLDIELTQMRRRSERRDSLELQAIFEYVKLSHEFRPSACFDSMFVERTSSNRSRTQHKLLGKPLNRISLRDSTPDPVNHDIPLPATAEDSPHREPLDGIKTRPKKQQTASQSKPTNRVVDSLAISPLNNQAGEDLKVALPGGDTPASGQSRGDESASALSSELLQKIQKQNHAIDCFLEQLAASSNEEQMSPTGPNIGDRFTKKPSAWQASNFRHMNSSPLDDKPCRASPEVSPTEPTSAFAASRTARTAVAPQVSRFTIEVNRLEPIEVAGRQPSSERPLEEPADPQACASRSSRERPARKSRLESAFNIRKSSTLAEASVFSLPAWK